MTEFAAYLVAGNVLAWLVTIVSLRRRQDAASKQRRRPQRFLPIRPGRGY